MQLCAVVAGSDLPVLLESIERAVAIQVKGIK